MSSLAAASPFGDLTAPGRFGKAGDGPAPVTVRERRDLQFHTLSANAGKDAEVAEAVLSATGLTLPAGPKAASKDGLAFIGTAPGQWLVVAQGDGSAQFDALRPRLAETATIVEQTDAKAVVEISGSRVRETLAKGCMIDLHPRVFGPGDAATTPIALIDCQIWQIDAGPTYLLAVPSSYAGSFWSWLTSSAAEFGYEVERDVGVTFDGREFP